MPAKPIGSPSTCSRTFSNAAARSAASRSSSGPAGGDGVDDLLLRQAPERLVAQLGVLAPDLGGELALEAEHRPVARHVRADVEVRGAAARDRHGLAGDRRRRRPTTARSGTRIPASITAPSASRAAARPRATRPAPAARRAAAARRRRSARTSTVRPSSSRHRAAHSHVRPAQREHDRGQRDRQHQRAERLGQQVARRRPISGG